MSLKVRAAISIATLICCGLFASPTMRPQTDTVDAAPTTAQLAQFPEPTATPTPTEAPVDEAALIAKAWYGFGNYYNDEVLESFVDFVDNRVRAGLFGAENIADVILRPGQWQGWSDSNPVLKDTYEKVTNILDDRANGGMRSIPTGLLYFNCEANGITYMTEFGGGKTWYVGD